MTDSPSTRRTRSCTAATQPAATPSRNASRSPAGAIGRIPPWWPPCASSTCWPACRTTRRWRLPSSTWARWRRRQRSGSSCASSTSTDWRSSPTATASTCAACGWRVRTRAPTTPVPFEPEPGRPLIPFGGGIDSIVTVAAVTPDHPDAALCVVAPPGARFAAIEDAAAVTGLPVTRIERTHRPPGPPFGRARLPQRARARDGRDHRRGAGGRRPGTARRRRALQRVVRLGAHHGGRRSRREPPMVEGRGVRARVRRPCPLDVGPGRLGVLLPATAHRAVGGGAVRSPAGVSPRLPQLQPCLPPGPRRGASTTGAAAATNAASSTSSWPPSWIASTSKPCSPETSRCSNPPTRTASATLLGLGPGTKPFECVGDTDECRAATLLAAQRADRAGADLLTRLRAELPATATADLAAQLQPRGTHRIPERYAPADLLVRAR